MKAKFILKNAADDTVLIPADLDYSNNNVAGAFLIDKMEGHEDEVLKVQLDMDGIREQLRKDREEGSDAE